MKQEISPPWEFKCFLGTLHRQTRYVGDSGRAAGCIPGHRDGLTGRNREHQQFIVLGAMLMMRLPGRYVFAASTMFNIRLSRGKARLRCSCRSGEAAWVGTGALPARTKTSRSVQSPSCDDRRRRFGRDSIAFAPIVTGRKMSSNRPTVPFVFASRVDDLDSKILSDSPQLFEMPIHEDDHDLTASNLLNNWQNHPDLNPTLGLPTWVVPVETLPSVHLILNSPLAQPYLASRLDLGSHIHPRIKVVQDNWESNENSGRREKLILLHPSTPINQIDLPSELQDLLRECGIREDPGPLLQINVKYTQFSPSYILSKLLPSSAQPAPSAFETVGHVAHLNLRPVHLPYRFFIGSVLLETLPSISTVIHKVGEVQGPFRTYQFELLAGDPQTNVQLTEHGVKLHFDMAKVYWCSRLSEERQRLLRDEIRDGQIVADSFSGVGALCLQIAMHRRNCRVWANDWNPFAVEALRANVARNGLEDSFEKIECGDAYAFLTGIGLLQQEPTLAPEDSSATRNRTKDRRHSRGRVSRKPSRPRMPDHVIMNFPLEAPSFLGALRWWPVEKKRSPTRTKPRSWASHAGEESPGDRTVVPRVHVYTFARADPTTHRPAEEVAVDLIATNLLPPMTKSKSFMSAPVAPVEETTDDVKEEAVASFDQSNSGESCALFNRREELDVVFGCNVRVHAVRDVAPGKTVFCVSFSATDKLLRHMQGDFQ
jgi:tRNA (guanine37-N1)-methyltransferase